jgi:hypothetical protein
VCSQKVSLLIYLSFSPVPKEGPTVALFPPTPLPEPQNSSFLHRLNNCDTISAYTPKMAFTARSKTTRSTPILTFETLILVDFSRGAGQLLPLQDRQQALVDTNVLLLGLDHPNALFTHRVDYAENVDVVGYEDLLQDAIQADEGTGATHAGAAVDHDGALVGSDSLPEGSHEPHQSVGWVGHAEIGPRGEMEVTDHSLLVAPAHHEL